MIRRWNPAAIAAPIGQYSHLASVPADHELVFVSGQVGVLDDGTLAGSDARSQTRQIFINIERLLDSLEVDTGAFGSRFAWSPPHSLEEGMAQAFGGDPSL